MFNRERRSGKGRRRVSAAALGIGLLVLTGAQGVAAQERVSQPDTKEDRPLQGQVVDARTGAPLVGALVSLDGSDWGVLSEDDGTFAIPGVNAGARTVVVEQIGYLPFRERVEVKDPAEALVLSVDPDTTLLEGIQGVLDRLEQRRKSTAASSWVFDRKSLVINTGLDALHFIESRTPTQLFSCSVGAECALVQGRVTPLSFYVDEMPFTGGLDYLRSLQPYDLQRIEVYGGGKQIRVYTGAFLEKAGKIRLQPSPFIV